MATDKLDAEKWAKRYEEICCEVYELPLPPMDEKLDEEEKAIFVHDWLDTEAMRRFLSELPQSTAGTIGAEEIVRGWWNEMGGKSGSVQPENITAMTIKRREIDELIERLSVLASLPATRMPELPSDAKMHDSIMDILLKQVPEAAFEFTSTVKDLVAYIKSLGGVK